MAQKFEKKLAAQVCHPWRRVWTEGGTTEPKPQL